MLPVGSQEHNHVWHILNNVAGLGGGPTANGQANNGHETDQQLLKPQAQAQHP